MLRLESGREGNLLKVREALERARNLCKGSVESLNKAGSRNTNTMSVAWLGDAERTEEGDIKEEPTRVGPKGTSSSQKSEAIAGFSAERTIIRFTFLPPLHNLRGNFYLFFFLDVDHFLKSLLNLLQYCFCFMFYSFGREARGLLAPRPVIEPAPPALEGEVLTTGPPGKSWQFLFFT